MKFQINGEERQFETPARSFTLAGLVEQMGLKSDRVAIELNREIVPRERWTETELKAGDSLEIVHFVGGGSGSFLGKRGLRSRVENLRTIGIASK